MPLVETECGARIESSLFQENWVSEMNRIGTKSGCDAGKIHVMPSIAAEVTRSDRNRDDLKSRIAT
jgi:hypothetical protein